MFYGMLKNVDLRGNFLFDFLSNLDDSREISPLHASFVIRGRQILFPYKSSEIERNYLSVQVFTLKISFISMQSFHVRGKFPLQANCAVSEISFANKLLRVWRNFPLQAKTRVAKTIR